MKKNLMLVAALTVCAVEAQVKLGVPFSDGMVLQRDRAVAVWGTADAGEKVSVSFADQTVSTTATTNGTWSLELAPMKASCESRTLTVKGAANELKVSDVLVGEVWFCSGQSNADVPLCSWNVHYRDAKGTMRARMTNKPLVRFNGRDRTWRPFTTKNLLSPSFSAMGVYFALELHNALGIPVGIFGAYVGGTAIERWTPPGGDLWRKYVSACAPYTMRGFIWYQGCANAKDGMGYVAKMHALYKGWSTSFKNPDLKLYYVQLAPWNGWKGRFGPQGIAVLQEAQEKYATEEKNAGMVVINDHGDLSDVHPTNKEIVGQRLALLALNRDYGWKDVKADSPTLKSWKIDGDKFVLSFNHVDSWYCTRWAVNGFEIAGADGKFVKAKVLNKLPQNRHLSGKDLIVTAPGITEPKKLRYLWSPPWTGELYNEADLPLGAFHIGD